MNNIFKIKVSVKEAPNGIENLKKVVQAKLFKLLKIDEKTDRRFDCIDVKWDDCFENVTILLQER